MKSLMYLTMLPSILCIHSLRKTKGYVGSAFGPAPRITPQTLDPISSPDTYAGVTVCFLIHVYQFICSTILTLSSSILMLVLLPRNLLFNPQVVRCEAHMTVIITVFKTCNSWGAKITQVRWTSSSRLRTQSIHVPPAIPTKMHASKGTMMLESNFPDQSVHPERWWYPRVVSELIYAVLMFLLYTVLIPYCQNP